MIEVPDRKASVERCFVSSLSAVAATDRNELSDYQTSFMSKVAKQPVQLPKGVEIRQSDAVLTIIGPKGELSIQVNPAVTVDVGADEVTVAAGDGSRFAIAIAGTTRSLLNNMVVGVSEGFEKKLQLVGVGYRAQAQGAKLSMSLGFSHPVNYQVPEGVSVETPSQTEVVVRGIDKQRVGQVAAEIRQQRPPEPYKGKGVRYADERVILKEAKKK